MFALQLRLRRFIRTGLLVALAFAGVPPAVAQAPFSPLSVLTPAEAVVAFYAALQARNFAAAYTFLSPDAQAERPFDSWAAGYASTERIDVQASAGDVPESVNVDLWVNDGELPHVHGYTGSWWLVMDGPGGGWLLDRAAIAGGPAPAFPSAPRPTESCTPIDPDPAMPTACAFNLDLPTPAGATISMTILGPQPVAGPLWVPCDSTTGGLRCLPASGAPNPWGVQFTCFPLPPAEDCPAGSGFTAGQIFSPNGGPLSEAITISPAEDGTSPTYFVVPSPPVTFTTEVAPAPPPVPLPP